MSRLFDDPTWLLYGIPVILISLTFHELAHGFIAYKLGDPTAKDQGRLTLNPIKHLDPIGTLMLLIANFGWAKPVPVNPFYFQGNRRRAMMLVALAGPVMNFLLSYLSLWGWKWIVFGGLSHNDYLLNFFNQMVMTNLYLGIFNLLPVPPLDGSKILAGFGNDNFAQGVYRMEQYGPLLLLILIVTNLTDKILVPIADACLHLGFILTGMGYLW
ncbi:MAG: site-2 protease family protein [Peptococcaceae bacterium]|nr:site-2 protease family protein [Peptococcaceae bacterium]